LHEALRREIVDLVGRGTLDDVGERGLVEEIGRDELDAIDEMRDAFVRCGGRAAHDPHHAIPLVEQQFGEVGAVLAGNAGDERGLGHETIGFGWWVRVSGGGLCPTTPLNPATPCVDTQRGETRCLSELPAT